MVHYRQASTESRTAYFKWKKERPVEKHSVVSFVAGYNAANKKLKTTRRRNHNGKTSEEEAEK
jgi:hypothetical protein